MRSLSPENQLFRGANGGKRVTATWIAIPLALLLIFVPAVLSSQARRRHIDPLLGGKETIEESALLPGLAFLLQELVQWLPVLFGLWLVVSFYESRRFSSLGLGRLRAIRLFLVGAAIGAIFCLVCTLAPYTHGAFEIRERSPHHVGWSALAGILLFGLGTLVQSPTEEVVFRGWLLPVVGVRTRPLVGVLVPGVLFGIIHAFGASNRTTLNLLILVVAGIVLGLIALHQQSIWGVMGMHWANNYTRQILNLKYECEYLPDAPFYANGANGDGTLIDLLILMICLGLVLFLSARRKTFREAVEQGDA